MLKKLTAAGLNKNEAKSYVALLGLGQASVSQIAKEAKVKRTNTYHVVSALLEKGLIAFVEGSKKALYAPAKPEVVLKMMRKKMELAEENYREMAELMPTLNGLYREARKLGAADSGRKGGRLLQKNLQAGSLRK